MAGEAVVAPPSLAEGEKKGTERGRGPTFAFAEGATCHSRRGSSEVDRTGIVVSRTTVGRSDGRLGTAPGPHAKAVPGVRVASADERQYSCTTQQVF